MKQETRERAGTVLEKISLVFTILFIVIDLLLYFFVSLVNLKVEFGCIERSHATADLGAYEAQIRVAVEEIKGDDSGYVFENNTEETSETTSSQERHEQHIPGVSDEGKKLKIIRNKIKRQVRAMCAQLTDYKKSVDVVFIIRKAYDIDSFDLVKNEMSELLKKLG